MSSPSWGDTVRVRADAPAGMRPDNVGEVVGMRDVDTAEVAVQFKAPIGSRIYLVEFADGAALEIAAAWVVATSP